MRHDGVSNFWVRDFVHVELGGIVQQRTRKPDAGEQRLRLVDGAVKDDPSGAHEEDVGEEMEDVGRWLVDGEEDGARGLLEVALLAGTSGELAKRVHHGEGAKAVETRRRLVAKQNSRPCQQLKGRKLMKIYTIHPLAKW